MFNHGTVRRVSSSWSTGAPPWRPGRLARAWLWLRTWALDGYDPAWNETWRKHGGLELGNRRRRRAAAAMGIDEARVRKMELALRMPIDDFRALRMGDCPECGRVAIDETGCCGKCRASVTRNPEVPL